MKVYNVEPIKSLTSEIIDNLIIHATLSSLRRAASVTPCVKRVDGDDKLPTLYYIKGSMNPDVQDWTIHALVMDINKYLLLSSYTDNQDNPESPVDPDKPLFIRSTIKWDGFTGKTADGLWVDPINAGEYNEELRFDGEIAWYDANDELGRIAGNRVGAVITPSQEMIDAYPNAVVYIEKDDVTIPANEAFYEYEDIGYAVPAFYYYPLISVPGQTNVVRIYWDKDAGIEESFPVIILQDATLEVNYMEVSTEAELLDAIATSTDVKLTSSIGLVEPLDIDHDINLVIDSESTLSMPDTATYGAIVRSTNGTLTISGEGTVDGGADDNGVDSNRNAVRADGGDIIIESGNFKLTQGLNSVIYAKKGHIHIYGGEFSTENEAEGNSSQPYWLLNVLDSAYKSGEASITVYGGRFHGFDPANNLSEGEGTNFVAEGYESIEVEPGIFEVRSIE